MPGLQSSLFSGMGLSGVSPSMHAMGVSSMSAYGSSFNPALFAHLGTLQRPVPHSNSTQAAATRMLEAQLMASSQGGQQSGQPSAGARPRPLEQLEAEVTRCRALAQLRSLCGIADALSCVVPMTPRPHRHRRVCGGQLGGRCCCSRG